jgi:hypothetical protein
VAAFPAWLRLASLLGAVALAASCDEEQPECGQELALYEQRIAPLFREDRPKSCNQCHLSGIDLGAFAKGDPCDSMACLVERGLVDLDDPESSLLLAWIDRAAPASEGITDAVIAEERAGFVEWIEMTAACGTCSTSDNPCGDAADWKACEIEPKTVDQIYATDPGDCSDHTLEALFRDGFFASRGRCYPCHFEGVAAVNAELAPKWVATGPCNLAALETYRRVTRSGYIDIDNPSQSLWIVKPLDEALGGVPHGGDDKIHSLEDDLYRQMVYFATRYAECVSP